MKATPITDDTPQEVFMRKISSKLSNVEAENRRLKTALCRMHCDNLEEIITLCEEDEYYLIVFKPQLTKLLTLIENS